MTEEKEKELTADAVWLFTLKIVNPFLFPGYLFFMFCTVFRFRDFSLYKCKSWVNVLFLDICKDGLSIGRTQAPC